MRLSAAPFFFVQDGAHGSGNDQVIMQQLAAAVPGAVRHGPLDAPFGSRDNFHAGGFALLPEEQLQLSFFLYSL